MNNKKINILLIIVIFLIAILTSCNTAENTKVTDSPAENPEDQISAIIKNNTFTSDTLGITMELPSKWHIRYETTPDYMGGVSLISGFDSTATINGSTPKLVFENDVISFILDKQDIGNPDLQFISTKDEYDGINIEQVIINMKEGFTDQSDKTFKDLPDLDLDGLIIKRVEVTIDGYSIIIHVFLNNDYTISLIGSYKYEADYKEMEDIISSIRIIENINID